MDKNIALGMLYRVVLIMGYLCILVFMMFGIERLMHTHIIIAAIMSAVVGAGYLALTKLTHG